MKGNWYMYLLILAIISVPFASATEIHGNFKETGTISSDWFETFHLNMTESGKVLDVKITTDKNVDFYLLTKTQYYDEFLNVTSISFSYEDARENARDYEWRGNGDYYLVVDNMNYSSTGAKCQGPVNYTIVVKLENKGIYDDIVDNIGYVLCGSVIIVAIATGSWLYKKPKLEEVLKK